MWRLILCLISIALLSVPTKSYKKFNKVSYALKHARIAPDVYYVPPEKILYVRYRSGVKVRLGNILTPFMTKSKPEISWEGANPDLIYTLIMVDPDAPSRSNHTERHWNHWLVVNIPGRKVHLGETLSEYIGPGPGPRTGLHRYAFLVFQQPSGLRFKEPRLTDRSAEKRAKFSIVRFVTENKLGIPIAGNFFRAQYDSYVPELYKHLGINQ